MMAIPIVNSDPAFDTEHTGRMNWPRGKTSISVGYGRATAVNRRLEASVFSADGPLSGVAGDTTSGTSLRVITVEHQRKQAVRPEQKLSRL
jgi:hypothetical protein